MSSLRAAEQPPLPELALHLRVGNEPPGLGVGDPLGKTLEDIEVVEDIVQSAIIGKLVEKVSNGSLRFHGAYDSTGDGPPPAAQRTRH
jgi:hypothetical protein